MARSIPYRDAEHGRALEVLDRVGPCRAEVIAQDLFDHYEAMGKNDTASFWFGVGNALKDIREDRRRHDEVKTKAKRTELKERVKLLRAISNPEVNAKVLSRFGARDCQAILPSKLDAALDAVNEEIEKRTRRKRKAATAVAKVLLDRNAYSQLRKVLDSFGVRKAFEVPPERVDELIAAYERALGEFEMLNRCKEEGVTPRRDETPEDLAALGYEIRRGKRRFTGKHSWHVVDRRTGAHVLKSNAGASVAADRFRKSLKS